MSELTYESLLSYETVLMSETDYFYQSQRILNILFESGNQLSNDQRLEYQQLLDYNINRMTEAIVYRGSGTFNTNFNFNFNYSGFSNSNNNINVIPHDNPLEKYKIISKKKLDESCPEACSICYETPTFKNAICTECDHYYCKACWDSWMTSETSNKSCPVCRKDLPKITLYRCKKINTATNVNNIHVIPDDSIDDSLEIDLLGSEIELENPEL